MLSRQTRERLIADLVFVVGLFVVLFAILAALGQVFQELSLRPFGGLFVDSDVAFPLAVSLVSATIGGAARIIAAPIKDLRADFENFRDEQTQAHDRLARRVDQHIGKEGEE